MQENRTCKQCKQEKPITAFHKNKYKKGGFKLVCKACILSKRKKQREERAAQGLCTGCGKRPPRENSRRCQRCYNKTNKRLAKKKQCECGNQIQAKTAYYCTACVNKRRAKLKKDAYSGYGACCACCGEDEPLFLSVDHIAGYSNMKHTPRAGDPLYRWLIDNNFPDTFQLLCRNCNYGKYANDGVCPHKEEK